MYADQIYVPLDVYNPSVVIDKLFCVYFFYLRTWPIIINRRLIILRPSFEDPCQINYTNNNFTVEQIKSGYLFCNCGSPNIKNKTLLYCIIG